MAPRIPNKVRNRSIRSTLRSRSAVTKNANAVSSPLADTRLRPGTSDARADTRVTRKNNAIGNPRDQGCSRRTAGSRRRQSHKAVSTASALSESVIDDARPTTKIGKTPRLSEDASRRRVERISVEAPAANVITAG